MEDKLGAFVFLGVLAFSAMVLVIMYCSIKHKKCFPFKSVDKTEDKVDETLLKNLSDSRSVLQGLPYLDIPSTVNGAYDDFKYVRNYDQYISDDDTLGELPKSHQSVRTGAFSGSSISSDDRFHKGIQMGGRKMKTDTYVDGCMLKFSLNYFKADMFMMVTMMGVSGMPTRALGGYKYIRVAITLLPEKKYRSTTQVRQVMGDDVITLGEKFKFRNVTSENLFTLAFRFRLYARNNRQNRINEVCTGELFVQLADVVQRSHNFVATKPFKRKR